MSVDDSEALLRELAADLAPVRRFPRLRVALAGMVTLWLSIGAALLLWIGPRSDAAELFEGDRAFAATALGLFLAGMGGAAAALAAMVPGRESLRLGGAAMALSAVAVAGFLCFDSGAALRSSDPLGDLSCISLAMLLALPLVAWMTVRALQGWVLQPGRVAVIALFAGVSMGALWVHLTCPAGAHSHFLAAHLGAGPIAAMIFALPLSYVLRRGAH